MFSGRRTRVHSHSKRSACGRTRRTARTSTRFAAATTSLCWRPAMTGARWSCLPILPHNRRCVLIWWMLYLELCSILLCRFTFFYIAVVVACIWWAQQSRNFGAVHARWCTADQHWRKWLQCHAMDCVLNGRRMYVNQCTLFIMMSMMMIMTWQCEEIRN